jgi:anhydro-N-acetylmuramic acid kinase
MSGTSGDGIDVALIRPRLQPGPQGWQRVALETVGFETVAFDAVVPGLGARVRRLLDAACQAGPTMALGEVARLDAELGTAFGRAVLHVARGERVDLVGSHGQTVWHPGGRARAQDDAQANDELQPQRFDPAATQPLASLQLGDGCFVAAAAHADVVSDFRTADLAAGGEGAPIASHVEAWLLGEESKWVLNLGGFSNLALMVDGALVTSFDTGPAGALLDGLARALLGQAQDHDGAAAMRGWQAAWNAGAANLEVEFERLIDARIAGVCLRDFAAQATPKSTGRERFGPAWIAALVELARTERWSHDALLAGAVEAVAWCVARGLESALKQNAGHALLPLYCAGGGVHNRALMAALQRHLLEGSARPVMASGSVRDDPFVAMPTALVERVTTTQTLGVPPDAREAAAFGLLACANVLGQALPLGRAVSRGAWPTGATRRVVLGKFSPASARTSDDPSHA